MKVLSAIYSYWKKMGVRSSALCQL